MNNKKLAEKHFGYLHDAWIGDEQKHYEEYFIVEGADNIPTSKLENHNYKDLRVIKDFFEERKQWKNGNMNIILMSNI